MRGRLAIIGGSGTRPPAWLQDAAPIAVITPFGSPAAPPLLGSCQNRELLWLPRHGRQHQLLPHQINYRANLWALQELEVTQIVAVNAVGGITRRMLPRRIVVPDQLIDYTFGREHSFADAAVSRHIEFTLPYTAGQRTALLQAARTAGLRVLSRAVYGAVQGPRLETAAEIERLRRDGCDLVGMTGMPEAALAAELGLPYACLAVIANRAAGRSRQALTLEHIHQNLAHAMQDVERLLQHWVMQSPATQ